MIEAIVPEKDSPKSSRSQRTCVACGCKKAPGDLLRVIRTPDGEIAIDWRRNLGGRAAHVCLTKKCIEDAIKRRRFGRAIKDSIRYPEIGQLIESMHTTLVRQLETIASSSIGARTVAAGTDETHKVLDKGIMRLMLIAKDGASARHFEEIAASVSKPVRYIETKERLGTLFGRKPTGVISIVDDGLSGALMRVLDRLIELE